MDSLYFTVFFPLNLHSPGYVYGWRLSENHACIAGIIQSTSLQEAEKVLLSTQNLQGLLPNGLQAAILGKCTDAGRNSRPYLTIHGMESDRCRYIFYQLPNRRRMHFLSLSTLKLNLAVPMEPSINLSNSFRNLHRANFLQPMERRQSVDADIPLEYINAAYELSTLLQNTTSGTRSTLPSRKFSQKSKLSKGASRESLGSKFSLNPLSKMLTFFMNSRVKTICDCAYQLDVRLEQFLSMFRHFQSLKAGNAEDIAKRSILHINLKNCLWLIVNDSIFGIYFGLFLWQNNLILGALLHRCTKWLTIDIVQDVLVWLDNWPVGLKLNTELSRFFYICFMTFTDAWRIVLERSAPLFPFIFEAAGVAGWFGMTMVLCLASDLLSLFTIHLHLSYLIATALFAGQISVAHSLWNLFRGKRYNALRNRTDSTSYDVDQLLVGTILLTLVAFTFPTVIVYYSLFALIRLAILLFHAVSEAAVASLNHFPLFVIMLRLKEPSCLPGGIYFENAKDVPGALVLRNLPIPLSHIFFQHFLLWSRLSAHYHPVRLLIRLVTGKPLAQISRRDIRYTMIPELYDNPTQ